MPLRIKGGMDSDGVYDQLTFLSKIRQAKKTWIQGRRS